MPCALSNVLDPYENLKRSFNNAEGMGIPMAYPMAMNGLGAAPAPMKFSSTSELLDFHSWTGWATVAAGAAVLYCVFKKKR